MNPEQMNLMIFGFPGGPEWVVILVFGLLLFGKRLPEIGRSVGKSIVEFKKGIKDVEEEVNRVDSSIDDAARNNYKAGGYDVPTDTEAMYSQDASMGTPDDAPVEPYTEPDDKAKRTTDTPEQASM
jgi:sec-independent protein translocase protein TatA